MFPRAALAALLSTLALMLTGAAAAGGKHATGCADGQVKVKGACAPACEVGKPFSEPHACECPAGYGKIFVGKEAGECRRLACRRDAPIDPALCECPAGTVQKAAGKGRARCVSEAATAKAR
jgi:hypothetical protein